MPLPRLKNQIPNTKLKTPIWNLEIGIWKLKRGFSLIELLVVITIIAILIGAGTVSYNNAQQKGRDGKRKSDLKSIQQALEQYFQANGKYPPIVPNDWIGWCARISDGTYTQIRTALEPTYIQTVPKDPKFASVSGDYLYYKTSNNTYQLASAIENSNDPDRSTFSFPGGCTSATYNFKVTNP